MNPKTKLYTEAQIRSAIRFWTKILERKNPLLDAMTEEFGYMSVFEDKTIQMSLDLFTALQKLLNRYVFNDELNLIPIEVDKSGNCRKLGSVMMYNYAFYDNPDEPGRYFLLD